MNQDEPLGTLTRDDLIILFEWAYRFCETHKLAFSHPAEVVVIDKLAGDLERVMAEPFKAEYSQILSEARERVLKAYEDHMGKTWVHEQPLNQS
jgi:hypothetical protein